MTKSTMDWEAYDKSNMDGTSAAEPFEDRMPWVEFQRAGTGERIESSVDLFTEVGWCRCLLEVNSRAMNRGNTQVCTVITYVGSGEPFTTFIRSRKVSSSSPGVPLEWAVALRDHFRKLVQDFYRVNNQNNQNNNNNN